MARLLRSWTLLVEFGFHERRDVVDDETARKPGHP
jgi:hypothetical protein